MHVAEFETFEMFEIQTAARCLYKFHFILFYLRASHPSPGARHISAAASTHTHVLGSISATHKAKLTLLIASSVDSRKPRPEPRNTLKAALNGTRRARESERDARDRHRPHTDGQIDKTDRSNRTHVAARV